MKEPPLDTFIDNLVRVLLHEVAFYIPKSIFPDELLRNLPLKLPEHFFDEVFYLDVKNGMMVFDAFSFNEKLLQKPRLFENNILQLLNKKEEFEERVFDYVLDKYFEKVQFYSNLVFFLSVKLEYFFKDTIDPWTKAAFELQLKFYKNHCLALIDQFYKGKEVQIKRHYNIDEIFESYFPDFVSRLGIYYKEQVHESAIEFSDPILQEEEIESQAEEESKVQKLPKKRLKKAPLLSDKEVEDFILSTVFNVTLNSK